MYKNIKIRIGIIIIIGFILSVVVYNYLNSFNDEVTIFVYTEDIPARTKIVSSYIKEEKISKEVKDKFFPLAITESQDVIDKITRVKVKKNQPIILNNDIYVLENDSYLIDEKGNINNEFFIPEDKRIIAVNLDSTGAINNSVSKGDFVDVIYTSKEASTGGIYSKMILQHVEVYDVEHVEITNNGVTQQKQNVLLLVSPEESIDVALAGRNGDIDFALNPLKGSTSMTEARSIGAFVVDPPMSIRDQLNYVFNYVDNSYIPSSSKTDILDSVDRALDEDIVDLVIRESSLDLKLKDQLLEILER